MPFGSLGQIRLPEVGLIWPKRPKTAVFRNMSFSRMYLYNVWSYKLKVLACRCAFGSFGQIRPSEVGRIKQKYPKVIFFLMSYIRNIQYSFELRGGLGLFVYHKYFVAIPFLGSKASTPKFGT